MAAELAIGRVIRAQVLKIAKARDISINGISRSCGRQASAVRDWLYEQRDDVKLSTLAVILEVLKARISIVKGAKHGRR